jgi:photosystem II stability/assembly factor-like uncharacterized protein
MKRQASRSNLVKFTEANEGDNMKLINYRIGICLVLVSLLLVGCADSSSKVTGEPEESQEQSSDTAADDGQDSEGPAAESERIWKMIFENEIVQPVRMAGFFDESFAITGGATGDGRTHYSLDGGATWTMSEGSGGCIYGIEIVDAQTVWVCGRNTGASFSTPGGVRLSLDGGQTWEEPADFRMTPGFCPLSFLDDQVGWFVSANKLNATFDGGVTVEEITLPEEGMNVAAISLLSDTEGYVLDYDGVIHITKDGGANWESRIIDLQRFQGMKPYQAPDVGAAAMRFLDQDTAVLVISLLGENKESALVALRTTDGGQTWTDETLLEKMGTPYISPDGMFITTSDIFSNSVRVFQYTGN